MPIILKKKQPPNNLEGTQLGLPHDDASNVVAFGIGKVAEITTALSPLESAEASSYEPSAQTLVACSTNVLPGIVHPDDEDDKLSPTDAFELTEDTAAEIFVQRRGKIYRCSGSWWYHWSDQHWKRIAKERVYHEARILLRELRGKSTRMSSRKAMEAVISMAAGDPLIAVEPEKWDQNSLLLGTPQGTVDLKIGKLLPADPDHLITRSTHVAPAAQGTPCPRFSTFLNEATGGNAGVERFLQQFSGYCLTGLTIEHALLFIFGPGGNGKSVFQQVLTEILGGYAVTAPIETFVASRHQRHPTEVAMLSGARLVCASETQSGQKWAEGLVNQFTGGDQITARFMRQDHFTFKPRCKLLIIGNHKPQLDGINDAARRRFRIVEFVNKPKKLDLKLLDKLREEYSAILRWMIDGCLDWQANGLVIPDAVKEVTEGYFLDQDIFGRWVDECCECGPGKKTGASLLFQNWKAFAEANGEPPGSIKTFAPMLVQRGFTKSKSYGIVYQGIAIKGLGTPEFGQQL